MSAACIALAAGRSYRSEMERPNQAVANALCECGHDGFLCYWRCLVGTPFGCVWGGANCRWSSATLAIQLSDLQGAEAEKVSGFAKARVARETGSKVDLQ